MKNGSAYWLYFQHLSWLLSPCALPQKCRMQKAWGSRRNMADEENEEEFSAAPEVGNEDLNGFQAEISTEENDRIEAEESGEIISGAIAGDSVDSGISLFSLDYYTDSYGAQLDGNAKALYDLLVQNYVVDYSQYLDSVDFPFEFPDTITFEAVVEDGSFQRKGESYVQATNDVKTAIQAASDAFFL